MNDTPQEQRSALDEFAAMSASQAPVQYQPLPTGTDTIAHGAMPVARFRDEAKVLQKLKALAAAMGQEFFYRYPVQNKRKGTTEWIEGPTIKLANDLARIYGNCEIDARVTDLGDSWLFYARFIDLETGFSATRPFQQRKNAARMGGDDDARRLDIAFQIGASKAIRNVICNALQTFSDFTFDEARNALVDRIGKDLENYRQRTAEKVAARVDILRVEAVIGRKAGEWLAQDVALVIAMMKAVTDGMSSLDETFPPLTDNAKAADNSPSQSLDTFARSSGMAGADPSSSVPLIATPMGLARESDEGNGAAGEEAQASDPAVDLYADIERRMSEAETPEAVQAVWDQLDLDARLEDDAPGRGKANKIMSKRLRELK